VTTGTCASCGRELLPGDERRAPRSVAWVTAIAFAFFHGGMWAAETMEKPFCARCVRKVATLAIAAAAVVLLAAAAGSIVWLRGPRG